ncbi:MAG: arylsulfatase, partial [Bacteroidota bacterium]
MITKLFPATTPFYFSFFILHFAFFTTCTATTNKNNSEDIVSSPPNIIYILADDLGYGDLSCYGQSKFSTPNIDRLAREGMLFTQHYSGAPVCAPARSVLMTGLHTGHTPVRGNAEVWPEGQEPLPGTSKTLAEHLQNLGYRTGGFGKWGLGYPGSEGAPENQGFDHFFGYNCQREAHTYWPEHLWRNEEKVILPANKDYQQRGTYAPTVIQKEALDFIRRNRDSSFFLYYAHTIPHAEMQAPRAYLDKYRGQFDPEVVFEGWSPPEPKPKWEYSGQKESHAAFAAMVNVLDDQIGELLSLLDSLQLTNNTLVIFTSDNGPHQEGGADPDYFDSNGPLRGYKRDLYEGGIRVPLLARWPAKVAAGSQSDIISGFQDML